MHPVNTLKNELMKMNELKPVASHTDAKEKTDVEESLPAKEVVQSNSSSELRGDPWRFCVAFVFCLISFSNAMQWITFSAIVAEVSSYFNMTAVQVHYLATTYVIVYVVAVFLSCKLYELTGLKFGIVVAAFTNAVGALIKLFALYFWPNMILLFIAQVFNSVTEILTIATPPLIANRWFTVNERMVANTVMSCALNFGCGIGVLLPTFFVTAEKQEQRHFGHLFWFQFALCFGAFLCSIFLIPVRPQYMTSYAAARQQKCEEKRQWLFRGFSRRSRQNTERNNTPNVARAAGAVDDDNNDNNDRNFTDVQTINIFSALIDALRALRQNFSFDFLTIASAAVLGLIWSIATVLPHSLTPFLVTEAEAGWVGFLNLVLGTVLVPFFMPFVERRRRYKTVLLWAAVVLTVSLSVLTLCFAFGPPPTENRKFYVVVAFVLWGVVAGLCQNFMMPLFFEFVVELTFPLAESTSAPVLTWAACLSNLILVVVFGEVLGNAPTRREALHVFIGATAVCVVGCISLLFVRPYRRRQEYEDDMQHVSDTREALCEGQKE